MVKKMIYIEEEMEQSLKRVAQADDKSVSELIREAIRKLLLSKEYYNLAVYDQRMAEYLGKPSAAVPFRRIMDD